MTNSKDRSNRMKKMFGNIDPDKLAKAPSSPVSGKTKPLVSSGAVKSMEDAFSGIEQENTQLRQQLASSETVISLATDLIEPSFVQDRMETGIGPGDDPDFEELKNSIEVNGQQLPILVRPSLTRVDAYQIAYGRRRLRACAELGLEIRAIVKELSDDELVIAQGRENNERKDLSFIETAVFALRLKERGFTRQTIAASLGRGSDKSARTYISKLTTIAQAIPETVIQAIGPAPKIGRQKWDKLSSFFDNQKLSGARNSAVNGLMSSPGWSKHDSNTRFQKLVDALEGKESEAPEKHVFTNEGGVELVSVQKTASTTRLSINHAKAEAWSEWLITRMPELIKEYEKSTS